MTSERKRKLTIGVCSLAFACAATARTYFTYIPRGARFLPWVLASVDGPVLRSPDGQRRIEVYFNDAGAAHRGNHWTWIVEDSWLLGRRVVAQGYLGPDVRFGEAPVPIKWVPPGLL